MTYLNIHTIKAFSQMSGCFYPLYFHLKIARQFAVSLFLFMSGAMMLSAQESNGILQQLKEDEKAAVEAIALYPENERNAILEVSTQPEVLVRMQNIREKTQVRFREELSGVPEEDKKMIFNLSRYSGLLTTICNGGRKLSSGELDDAVAEYSEETRDQARRVYRNYQDETCAVDKLYQSSDTAFVEIIGEYPQKMQEAYRQIVQMPEVVSILNENMSMTVLLGDIYKRQPENLRSELDSLNVVLAEQRAREFNDWKQYLEEHPEAMAEYEAASKSFAREQGYDETLMTEDTPEEMSSEIHIHHYWEPYPYWFGWPWWYNYRCWYPYPWWVHGGYYYGPGNVIVFVGLPSGWYMHWYFNHYAHFYYYPHFTGHVVNHYYGHRRSNSSVVEYAREWEAHTGSELSHNWLEDEAKRVDRIREYGKYKMDYQSVVNQANENAPARSDFLRQRADQYPALKPLIEEKPKTTESRTPDTRTKEPAPDYKPSPSAPRKKIIERQPSDQQRSDGARDYHRNTWERTAPNRQVTPPRQTIPPPQQQPQRAPTTPAPRKKSSSPKK